MCLVTFETNNIYLGVGWKKKYKAPTDFGFAIKVRLIEIVDVFLFIQMCNNYHNTAETPSILEPGHDFWDMKLLLLPFIGRFFTFINAVNVINEKMNRH